MRITGEKFMDKASAVSAAVMLVAATASLAADYPVRPVRVVVPYSPGGGTDFTARTVSQKLASALGQTFVVDNRPGAAGIIGTQIVAAAQPDGYTIVWNDNAHLVNPLVFKDAKYDALGNFEPIAQIAAAPQMLAGALALPANTLRELLALPRAQTAGYAIGSSGLASVPHFTYERLRLQTGLTLVHVPYKGSGASLADLLAGQIMLAMNSAAPAIPLVQGKRIKGLGVAATSRLRQLPEVPTFNESGLKDFTAAAWYGVLAPKGTPRAIVVLLNREIRKALALPDVIERFNSQALEMTPGSPADFGREIAAETERWKVVIKQTGFKLE
jgi:tripartite-type tricarboxylate transporter receptor subunit TctC